MKHPKDDSVSDATMQAIRVAIQECYGNPHEPNFRKVADKLKSNPYNEITEALLANGVSINDTTDLNDDVSVQLVLSRSGDRVGLGLSCVGPYAALTREAERGGYDWITQPETASTGLGALTATIVAQAGLQLLDRRIAVRTVPMNHSDGVTEVSVYRALFTDTDLIP